MGVALTRFTTCVYMHLNVGGVANVPSVVPLNGVSYDEYNVCAKRKCISCTFLCIKHIRRV